MSYLIKIGNDVHGPYTENQVVGYFDAGHINADTRIVDLADEIQMSHPQPWLGETADPFEVLERENCLTVGTSELFKHFPELRATAGDPALFYLRRIAVQQEIQIKLLRNLRFSVAGIGIALAIVFFLAARH